MTAAKLLAAFALFGAIAATAALAQQPQTIRLRGVVDKLDGHAVLVK
jgi:hypothetical protein